MGLFSLVAWATPLSLRMISGIDYRRHPNSIRTNTSHEGVAGHKVLDRHAHCVGQAKMPYRHEQSGPAAARRLLRRTTSGKLKEVWTSSGKRDHGRRSRQCRGSRLPWKQVKIRTSSIDATYMMPYGKRCIGARRISLSIT